jgi:hypothetical protein
MIVHVKQQLILPGISNPPRELLLRFEKVASRKRRSAGRDVVAPVAHIVTIKG